MPAWLLVLQLALQLEPEIAKAINIAFVPVETAEQRKALLDAMDAAVNAYIAKTAKPTIH